MDSGSRNPESGNSGRNTAHRPTLTTLGAVRKVEFKLLRVMRFPMREVRSVFRQAYQWSVTSVGSTCIDAEQQFPVFSDGTPPLFGQAPHIVDQTDQVIPVNSYPLFFHTVVETGRTEALVCFHIVQNLSAIFKPDSLLIPVFVLVARRPYSGGKVVQQRDQLLLFNEAGRVRIPVVSEKCG